MTSTFNGDSLQVEQDTDNESLGQTTIAALGNEFQITTFFDLFVDIELATAPPLTMGCGPLHVELQPVPEPSGRALLLLPLAGLAALHRHCTS